MVRRTKSMEATIKEGEDYLDRTQKGENQIVRNSEPKAPRKQTQEEKKKQYKRNAELKKQMAREKAEIQKKITKEKPTPKKLSPPKRETIKGNKKQGPKQQEQKQKEQQKKKIEKIVESKQVMKIEKKPAQVQGKKKEVQQPPQAKLPRKTQSNLSNQSGKTAAGMVDCVFVVDTTGSMDIYLEKTTDVVLHLVERVKEQMKGKDISVKFGFVCYRDHPPQEMTYVTQVQGLCNDKEILQFIEKMDCFGGGDGAEAALDGLNAAATEIEWRDSSRIPSLRYIFHITDQPPHGREFGGYSESWDDGCPCGLKADQVMHRINVREIHYRLIKASSTRLEKFAEIFKKNIVNYDEVTLDEGVADGMEIKISDMVIRELCPDIIYD